MKEKFFREARKEAALSDYDGAHLGAVAVYKDKYVLARAHNTYKTNPTQFKYNRYRIDGKSDIMLKPPRSHAEISLYRKIRYLDIDFSDITVYVYREYKNGELALASPCPSCEQMLRDAGIRTVCFTTNGGYVEQKYYPR